MTIIAGFNCSDGVLLCSDTEETLSETSKNQIRKVPYFRVGKATLAIGGAGDGALADYITQDLVKHFSDSNYDWKNIENWLNDYAHRMFRRHVREYAGLGGQPDVAFLIAVAMEGRTHLFKWERNFAYLIPPPLNTSIGIGTVQSQELLSRLRFEYPYRQMLFFAVRTMQTVKRLVPGCGGKTEVLFISHAGARIEWPGIFRVDEIEHIVDMCDEFIDENVLSFISNTEDIAPTNVDSKMESWREAFRNLREKYRDAASTGVRLKEGT